MDITLKRVGVCRHGTFGVLIKDGLPLCVTLEDLWKLNQTNISCIPPGTYKCVRFDGAKFKGVWILQGVPARSYILIHSGNTSNDTHGCILVGDSFSDNGIGGSKSALKKLQRTLPDIFNLVIIDS